MNLLYERNNEHSEKYLQQKVINNLDLQKIDKKKFTLTRVLKLLPNKISLFETILVAANDELVNLFLNKKIKFTDISKNLLKILGDKEFSKFKRITPKNVAQIIKLNDYVRLKINSKSI